MAKEEDVALGDDNVEEEWGKVWDDLVGRKNLNAGELHEGFEKVVVGFFVVSTDGKQLLVVIFLHS